MALHLASRYSDYCPNFPPSTGFYLPTYINSHIVALFSFWDRENLGHIAYTDVCKIVDQVHNRTNSSKNLMSHSNQNSPMRKGTPRKVLTPTSSMTDKFSPLSHGVCKVLADEALAHDLALDRAPSSGQDISVHSSSTNNFDHFEDVSVRSGGNSKGGGGDVSVKSGRHNSVFGHFKVNTGTDLENVLDRYDTESHALFQTRRLNSRGLANYLCLIWEDKSEAEVRNLLKRLITKVELVKRPRFANPRKTVWFVRPGEAEHIPVIERGKLTNNPEMVKEGQRMLDPPLTEEGRQLARALRRQLEEGGRRFDLVVVSPLVRAMESAYIAFHGLADKFLVTPEVTDTAQQELGSPQKGLSVQQLLEKCPFAASWDMSAIVEGYNWEHDGIGYVASGFRAPERSVGGRASAMGWFLVVTAELVRLVEGGESMMRRNWLRIVDKRCTSLL